MSDVDRKARLAAIRAGANKGKEAQQSGPEGQQAEEIVVKFRNYRPQDSALQTKKRPHTDQEEGADGAAENAAPTDNKPAKNRKVEEEQEQDVISRELRELASDEINIVPKKPNWDLKQQVNAKLDKLRRRTQRAIVEVLREKVAAEAETDDID